jgi:uncharacterized membrane protein
MKNQCHQSKGYDKSYERQLNMVILEEELSYHRMPKKGQLAHCRKRNLIVLVIALLLVFLAQLASPGLSRSGYQL